MDAPDPQTAKETVEAVNDQHFQWRRIQEINVSASGRCKLRHGVPPEGRLHRDGRGGTAQDGDLCSHERLFFVSLKLVTSELS